MDEDTFLKKLGNNGKEIFTLFKLLASKEQGLALLPTDGGFHLCYMKEVPVRIIQIWPSPKNWLESRLQFIDECVVLTEGDRKDIRRHLANIGFTPTKGEEGNMRFRFGALKGPITITELDRMEKRMIEISNIIRKAPTLSTAMDAKV